MRVVVGLDRHTISRQASGWARAVLLCKSNNSLGVTEQGGMMMFFLRISEPVYQMTGETMGQGKKKKRADQEVPEL